MLGKLNYRRVGAVFCEVNSAAAIRASSSSFLGNLSSFSPSHAFSTAAIPATPAAPASTAPTHVKKVYVPKSAPKKDAVAKKEKVAAVLPAPFKATSTAAAAAAAAAVAATDPTAVKKTTKKIKYSYTDFAVKAALMKFRELNDDIFVSHRFVIPKVSDKWPEETWGMHLGAVTKSIKAGHSHAPVRAELEALGYDFKTKALLADYQVSYISMRAYYECYGDLLVPMEFVVPAANKEDNGEENKDESKDENKENKDGNTGENKGNKGNKDGNNWPEESLGLKLGNLLANIQRGRLHKGLLDDLAKAGMGAKA